MIQDNIVQRAELAIREGLIGLLGPLAHDMPFTRYTISSLQRLALRTLATMHGSSFQGDGKQSILALGEVVRNLLSSEAQHVFTGKYVVRNE